jgi:N-acyl-D-amino-acid deacylase
MKQPDLIISNGTLVDGTGKPGVHEDVAISNGKISDIGAIGATDDVPVLDATDLYVTPGFIDIHSHSDFSLVVDPRAVSAVSQGVTLEVVGNCGHGCAPIENIELASSNIYGYQTSLGIAWKTMAGYLDHLESRQPAVNVISLVANGNLRLATIGLADRPATGSELKQMENLLAQAMEEGAYGYSTGLEYNCEKGCSEEEIIALCRVANKTGGIYATHTRNRAGEAKETIAEAIRTADAADIPLQISHIATVARLSPDSRWAVQQAIDQVETARARGQDVTFDQHTRMFGTTNLSTMLPPWALEGGPQAIAIRLKDPKTRSQMSKHASIIVSLAQGDWNRIVIFRSRTLPEISQKSLAEIAQMWGVEVFDAVFDILLAEIDDLHALMVICLAYNEEDLHLPVESPFCMPGSDAIALAPDGPLQDETFHGAYTWAGYYYRTFVRDKALISPAEAIRRMTSLPAHRMGLKDRGVIQKGNWADIAVFHPAEFTDRGTTFEPNQLCQGMRHVLVNGKFAMRDGELTATRAGKVLRS